jgi:hypothetical protein
MTLKELRAAFLYDTAFDLDGFSERVKYWPRRGGAMRELTANPVLSVPAAEQETRQGMIEQQERVAFDVGDNPDHEEHGGIEQPRVGDGVGLASLPDTSRWGVESVEPIAGGWRLRCVRSSLVSLGAQQQ